MDKLSQLQQLASQQQLNDKELLEEIFKADLVNLFNWMPAFDVLLRMRGEQCAESMLFNLVTLATVKALDEEDIELSRSLHGIRAVLNRHPEVNFAYARWLTHEEGLAVLDILRQKGLKPLAVTGDDTGDKPDKDQN